MSSRADMIGSGPSSGLYRPSPTPTEESSMPVYINDELLSIGGVVNGILEGGAFPPQGKMPVRWREGMMMYFIEPLEDTYVAGEFKGQKIITSAGVWLYRRSRWWKIIDDPSSIAGTVFAFRLTADGTPPSTPSPSTAPPANWSDVPPVKNTKSEWIWITMSAAYNEVTEEHTWTQPTPWSAGVTDGIDGIDGEEGLTNEQRFIAWGDVDAPPVLADNTARNPQTTEGFPFVLSIPPTNPPTTVYIYTIVGKVGAETDTLRGTWSAPVLYSTPDTTQLKRAWATSTNWGDPFPSFTPSNQGLPGPAWTYTQPAYTRDYPIWMTERLEFLNGAPQTQWTTPVGWNAQDGVDGAPGAPGLDGRIFEQWFQQSATQPQVPSNVYPLPSPWSKTMPTNPTNPVWMTFIKVRDDGSGATYPWSFPIKVTGVDGVDGEDGATGPIGPTGPAGEDGNRGTLNISKAISGSSWSNLEAYNAIVGDPNSGGVIRYWDTVTLFNSVSQFSEQRYYTGGTGPSSTWQTVALFVDGDAIINGTIGANKLVSNSITANQIAANTITGNEINAGSSITIGGTAGQDVVILDATNPNARIWVGNTNSSSADFSVDPSGNMYARNATFAGNISSTATITGGTLQSAQINSANGAFVVDSSGNMFATGGKIGAADIGPNWLDVQTSTTGGMRVMNSGSAQAGFGMTNTAMQGGLSGTVRMWAGGNSSSAPFQVSSTGDLYANNGYFGGTITAEGFTGAVGTAVDSVIDMVWLLTSASSNPITTIATIQTPRQNYDRVASVTFTPAHVRKPVNANDNKFGVRYTALQGLGVNPSYRLLPVNSSDAYYSLSGNTYGSLDFLGSNSDNTIFSVTNSITWSITIPATATAGTINIPLNVNLNQPNLPYPLGATAAPFTMDTGTVSVTISKADSGIIIN